MAAKIAMQEQYKNNVRTAMSPLAKDTVSLTGAAIPACMASQP